MLKYTIPSWGKDILTLILLVAAVFALYCGAFDHSFLINWDDEAYVTANETVRGFTLEHLKSAFTNFYLGNYAPLHIISYMLDYTLWGMRAGGFLFTNILLHAINGGIFYLILLRLYSERLWAFLGAALFLFHPVQVESVAWISERKNVLAMFFFLIAYLLYVRYREGGKNWRKSLYCGSLTAFTLALLSKSIAVILPVVLLFHDAFQGEKGAWRKNLKDKLPFLILAVLFSAITVYSQSAELGGGRREYYGGAPSATAITMLPVFARYLGTVLWPLHLSASYYVPVRTIIDLQVIVAAVILTVTIAVCVFLSWRQRLLGFWGILFLAGLAPVSQIVPIDTLMNDRYLYFPMLGVAGFVCGMASMAAKLLPQKGRRVIMTLMSPILISFMILSWQHVKVWKNSTTLWEDAVKKEPESSDAWACLGDARLTSGDRDAALDAYLRSYNLFQEKNYHAMRNIGEIYLMRNEPLKGRPYLTKLAETGKADVFGFIYLGDNYMQTGEFALAAEAYRHALHENPVSAEALQKLGDSCLRTGALTEAENAYRGAIAAGGDKGMNEYRLAEVATVGGHTSAAIDYLDNAMRDGFRAVYVVQHDPHLARLHALPRYRELLTEMQGI